LPSQYILSVCRGKGTATALSAQLLAALRILPTRNSTVNHQPGGPLLPFQRWLDILMALGVPASRHNPLILPPLPLHRLLTAHAALSLVDQALQAFDEEGIKDIGVIQSQSSFDRLEREKFQTITGRFASFQAQWLNVHVDFPLLQRIALPITIGSVRYPGIKIHETRIIRLMEVLLHGGTHAGGWTAKEWCRNVTVDGFQCSSPCWPNRCRIRHQGSSPMNAGR
jgi:hypothetical protein